MKIEKHVKATTASLSFVCCLLSLLALPAWARYKPADFEAFPELPVVGSNGNEHFVTLTNANYKVTGVGHVVQETSTGAQPKGAIRLADGIDRVTIWMAGGSSLEARGLSSFDAGDSYSGGAGIYLPDGKTLVFRCVDEGEAYVRAYGGAGANAKAGAAGDNGNWESHGAGGDGGRGAHAGGAGIGGYGGSAGKGGNGHAGGSSYGMNGSGGNNGGDGADGSGTIWCYDGVYIEAAPGQGGNASQTTQAQAATGGSVSGGGCGGGGGACGGWGGKGGNGGGSYSGGGNGGNSTSASGGSGGSGSSDTCPGGNGGNGGGTGNASTPAGGSVWCVRTDQLTLTAATVKGYGCGGASSVAASAVEFDFNGHSPTNAPDRYELVEPSTATLFGTAIEPPAVEGWTFDGYFTAQTGGSPVIDARGNVNRSASVAGVTRLFARWTPIPAVPAEGSLTKGSSAYALKATVSSAPERQDTYCTWYYRKTGDETWTAFVPLGATRDYLATGDSVEVSAAILPVGTPSGEYEFQCRLVSTRWGTRESVTNACPETVTFTYVRRDPPEYDAETKTLWANGSALRILRDTREADRVVVYWDQAWDGVYEGAFPHGLTLSVVDGWVNGGFRDGAELGGGVKIDFVSGEIYGLDAGDKRATGAPVNITLGDDAQLGNGGKKNW